MSVITSRKRGSQGQVAVSAAGQLEPAEPAYTKPNSTSRPWASQAVPSEPTEWMAPIVYRGQRTNGMRYLYAHGGIEMPISFLGTGPDIGIATWNSSFQPDQVTLHDWGFNDLIYQAGYPGFNLGLSFKVQKLPQNATGGPGYNLKMGSTNIRVKLTRVNRATNKPSVTG